jgi:glycine/D-amino acid oxidase-like deaminating enzyme
VTSHRVPGRIAVLGAGLQGACLALELAARGARVDLYERNGRCVDEASAHNEGKIHLGYVYAQDRSFDTARLMATGAICFETLLRRWLGDGVSTLPTSTPVQYVIHRGSLITADEFEAHARKVARWLAEHEPDTGFRYFGREPQRLALRLRDADAWPLYRPASAVAVFATEEVGIDPEALAELVRRRLDAEPGIRCLTGRTVVAVREHGAYLDVASTCDGDEDTEGYDYVANALWSGRLAVDAQLGLCPERPWLYRYRYFLRARTTTDVPSATIVLGPYGGIVNFGGGSVCLSWYPAGTATWSTAVLPPRMTPVLNEAAAAIVRDGTLAGLATVVPGIDTLPLRDVQVKGGWIFARGETDIDDPSSGLHRRSAIGVHRRGRYLTIDTGKLTVAPLFAARAAEMLSA